MRRQNPVDIVMVIWEQINTSPWITLRSSMHQMIYGFRFEMQHSKTGKRRIVQLVDRDIHRLDDPWTYKYVSEQLTLALAALTRNSAEAGVGSLDVYREDYPA